MSSAALRDPHDPAFYQWNNTLLEVDYLTAQYQVTVTGDGMAAAVGMAMEQSVATTKLHDYFDAACVLALGAWSIRVRDVVPLGVLAPSVVSPYQLSTETYRKSASRGGTFRITLSVPLCLIAGKPSQLWNILVGELPRLGFIIRFNLLRAQLPLDFGPGPAFGVAGLRMLTGQETKPLLCRAMRPAIGISDGLMAKINEDVLCGGFHIVKDDELQVYATFEIFAAHLRAMLDARDRARASTGENKLYFANLICEPWELLERWELCCSFGVDGVLVAPWIQGLGTVMHLARQKRMPILAHNTCGELFTRHPDWHVSEAVLNHWLRVCGADMLVCEGNFGNVGGESASGMAALAACRVDFGEHAPLLPILQGGKNPQELPCYRSAIGSDNFMLIVASWVDSHPLGTRAAASEFRAAL